VSTDQIITANSYIENIDFVKGVVLLVDKPIGWTSFDVVNKIRFKIKHGFGIKKIKVGHAGTLDPLATGLLIVCTGKLTKTIDFIQAENKVYTGRLILGATTATYDSEQSPDAFYPTAHINDDLIHQMTNEFVGAIEQLPPAYSAIKINGEKAYNLARKGKDVELKSRSIHIHSFKITAIDMPELKFDVKCSKGTYIRSLAHDYGKKLVSGAYLSSLRRESIGDYNVIDAWSMDDLIAFIDNAAGVQEVVL
jgi:tRNA pseudouridine55 synthase